MTSNLAETPLAKSRPSVPYGANLFWKWIICLKRRRITDVDVISAAVWFMLI